jgi:dolichol-phosphate mannosyltransferase
MYVFVTLPTYNESGNIKPLIEEIRRLGKDIGIVVADDDSPDGTWKIVQDMALEDDQLFLLRRFENKGRGTAGAEAFQFALDHGADVIIEMDADYSHHPKYIPAFLEAVKRYDLVLGSRSVSEGRDLRPSALRKYLTVFSSFYARSILNLPVKDCNSGFRCYRRDVLETIDMQTIRSVGPSIVQEILYKAHLAGFTIGEIPIDFIEREVGTSNLNLRRLMQGFVMVLNLRFLRIQGKL